MTVKKQIQKLKDNWLLVLLVVVVLGAVLLGGNIGAPYAEYALKVGTSKGGYDMAETAVASRAYYPPTGGDFAPEAEQRIRIKSSSLSTEVKAGEFDKAAQKLKNIVTASGAFLLDENVNQRGTDKFPYHIGTYRIKVETEKYDSVAAQLKEIGTIKSFNENVDDVTGTYTDLRSELSAEKAKLRRYEEIYAEAEEPEDKLSITDRIFSQERRIKYLEQRIDDLDSKVSYSSIYVSMMEKQSGFAQVAFVGFSELVANLVASLANLLKFVFFILPWAAAIVLVAWIVKLVKKKK